MTCVRRAHRSCEGDEASASGTLPPALSFCRRALQQTQQTGSATLPSKAEPLEAGLTPASLPVAIGGRRQKVGRTRATSRRSWTSADRGPLSTTKGPAEAVQTHFRLEQTAVRAGANQPHVTKKAGQAGRRGRTSKGTHCRGHGADVVRRDVNFENGSSRPVRGRREACRTSGDGTQVQALASLWDDDAAIRN